MVRPEGVEPPTYWFVASCSIQLSYGRTLREGNSLTVEEFGHLIKPLQASSHVRFVLELVPHW